MLSRWCLALVPALVIGCESPPPDSTTKDESAAPPSVAAQAKAPEPKPKSEPRVEPEPAAPRVDPKTFAGTDGTYDYGKDAIGKLETGLADAEIVQLLGEPESKDGREEEAATGDIVDLWHYPTKGIVLTMSSKTMTSAQWVRGISVDPPCSLATKAGIAIGSTRAEVRAAYGPLEDPDFRGEPERFIVGTLYGGLFLDFADDAVTSMYLGDGAE